jgi:hypothetical protein
MTDPESKASKNTEREKPPFLYHASPDKNIKKLEPRKLSDRNIDEGPKVFATPDKSFVSCFIARTDDTWTQIGVYNTGEKKIYTHCISDEKRFRELDKGGAIYTVSSESFDLDITQGFREWTSYKPVDVMKKEEYETGLDAMIENEVRVYFCNKEQLEEIRKNTNDFHKTFELLDSITSENEKRGLEQPLSNI